MKMLTTQELVIFNWQEASLDAPLGDQIKEILAQMNTQLMAQGIPFSRMLKHTIAIKNNSVDPLLAIQQFHGICTALAPELKDHPSVGTIFRVPHFTNAFAMVAIEAVFARTDSPVTCVRFEDIPMDVARALKYQNTVFLTGFEALELLGGDDFFATDNIQVKDSLEDQIDVIMDKIMSSLMPLSIDMAFITKLSLYLREDQDPIQAELLVRQAIVKRTKISEPHAPSPLKIFILRGNGMVLDSFKIEIDGIGIHNIHINNLDKSTKSYDLPKYFTHTCPKLPTYTTLNNEYMRAAADSLAQYLLEEITLQVDTQVALQIVIRCDALDLLGTTYQTLQSYFETQLRKRLPKSQYSTLDAVFLRIACLTQQTNVLEMDVSLFLMCKEI